MKMTKIVEIGLVVTNIPNLVANDYKSHVVVNGVVTFWLISTSVNVKQGSCQTMGKDFLKRMEKREEKKKRKKANFFGCNKSIEEFVALYFNG
jgi:hypothetical protein